MAQLFKLQCGLTGQPASVINLSDHFISHPIAQILQKGLKYIPKPEKIQRHDVNSTFDRYSRQVKLKYYL